MSVLPKARRASIRLPSLSAIPIRVRIACFATNEIGHARDLSRRLPTSHANDEVGRLTASFNGMLARLEQAYQQAADALESQKRFVSDASHECGRR